ITLIISMAAYIVRAMRSATIDGLATEYATQAELKGVPRRRVLWRHVSPTAVLPVLPIASINVAWLLGGVVVVESVFNYPGLGKLMLDSVSTRDLPVLQAIAVLSALIYVVANLISDLIALAVDPRLRTGGRARRIQQRQAQELAQRLHPFPCGAGPGVRRRPSAARGYGLPPRFRPVDQGGDHPRRGDGAHRDPRPTPRSLRSHRDERGERPRRGEHRAPPGNRPIRAGRPLPAAARG